MQQKTSIRLIFIALLFLSTAVVSQGLLMKGRVRDGNTHRYISNVNIYIPDLDIGAISDASGFFEIDVTRPEPDMRVNFQHIGYDTLSMLVEEILSQKIIELQERLIPLPVVAVESVESQLEIHKDLPQSVSIMDARVYDLHGFIDAGDLLRTDQSIQVDEELSGKKTVSIRGGNPDEVIVMFNGIRLNSALDNIYDVSLIDLKDVERLEIIRGSNTALYGSEAFSGVINVVPRARQDYKIRFQQRIGSYNSGDWGLHLYNNFGKLHAGYSLKEGESQRTFANEPDGRSLLENQSTHHTASLAYHFSETASGTPKSTLGLMYLRSDLDYQNERDSEKLNNFNQMISARFKGNIGNLTDLNIAGAYQWLDESQFLHFADAASQSGFLSRDIDNRSWHLNAEKLFRFNRLNLLVGYQFKQTRLEFLDDRFTFSGAGDDRILAAVKSKNHGIVSVAKYFVPVRSSFFEGVNFDLSFRYDIVTDEGIAPVKHSLNPSVKNLPVGGKDWREETVKLSVHTAGNNGHLAFNGFLNLGSNVKFPTLLQQISTREAFASEKTVPRLQTEQNNSIELGFDVLREVRAANLFGWHFSANIFHNAYENKFRSYSLPGTPIAFYDNVPVASITGIEANQKLFLFRKKVTMEIGASRYFLSDQSTFPFKYDRKYTFDIRIDESGYSLRLHAFKEGEQIAQIRNLNGMFSEEKVDAVGNFDIFFSKSFSVNRLKLFYNASLRNLLNDDYELGGLTLRDRRYYFTLGVQY